MALRLAGHDDRVEGAQLVDEGAVLLDEGLPVRPGRHFRPERRVVLRQRVPTLDLEVRLARPRDRMEEDRLFDRRHERVADPA